MDKLLRTYLEIMRSGSLTVAASRLNITQPSLTKRLQQLEYTYGTPLFGRSVAGAKPTPAGIALLPHAERIEAEATQSLEAVAAVRDERLEALRIGAGPLFHLCHLAGPLQEVRQAFPETRIELVAGLYRETMADLAAFRLDVVFGAHEARPLNDHITFVPMTQVEQGVALRTGHPLAKETGLSAADLVALDWIVYGKTLEDAVLLNSFFARAGILAPTYRFVTSSFTAGLQAVATSDAGLMVPIQLTKKIPLNGLTIHQTSPAIALTPAGAFTRRATLHFEIVNALLELVRRSVTEGRAV